MLRYVTLVPIIAIVPLLTGCGSDHKRIQGMWEPIEVQRGNTKVPEEWFAGYTVVEFFKDTMIIRKANRADSIETGFSVNSATSPRQIDLETTEADTWIHGIYEFQEKDQVLLLCLAEPGTPRPTSIIAIREMFEDEDVNPSDKLEYLIVKLKRRPPEKKTQ